MIKIGNVGAAGRIHAQVFKKVDGVLVPVGPEHVQDNIVTAGGLAALTPTKANILKFTALSNVINLGVGTQAEQESVDTLADYVTRGTGTRTVVSTVDFDNFEGTGEDLRVRTYRVQHQFEPTGVDRNYTEIGLGPDGSAGGLHTYALFRDAAGNPAAITVRADEYFNITYTYQVQAFRLKGFRTSTHVDLRDSEYVLAPKANGGAGLPIGPFPISGLGVSPGTEAWVFTAPRGTYSNSSAGVSYTTDPNYDSEALAALLPTIRGYVTSGSAVPYVIHDVLGNTAYSGTNSTNSPMANIANQLTSANLPLTRRDFVTSSTGVQVIPPGSFGDTTAYVYMWGSSRRGSIVMLTKPIVVEPDMEFTIDESIGLAWTVNPAVNKPWIDPEG